ncbi:MAG: Arylsulfatase [Opitutia bacterium UBA7350]|nr:MAG: Arylsulfatase [Opitutae bacterium UBA7350]
MRLRILILFISLIGGVFARPNILYINADDLGVMDVGYNNSKFRTPHLDRLAAEGLVFENGYAPAANCAPSRACVHSGQWGARHGVYTVGSSNRGDVAHRKLIPIQNRIHLPAKVVTIAEALQAGGYRTIHLGKYHIGEDPLKDGFEVNIGGDYTGGPKGGGYFSPWDDGSMKKWSDTVPAKTHRIDIYVKEAIRFIEAHCEEPMFIHFSPYLVHGPITPVPDYVGDYQGTWLDTAYASMVEKLDDAIGHVLQALEANGLTEKTLVVFCSDNGGIAAVNAQTPWRAGKGSYYEGGVREPMLISWPGTIKPGRCEELVNALDFYPTFLEVAGIESLSKLDGVSLMPLMTGVGDWKAMPQFWHFPIYLQAYNGLKDEACDPLFRTRPGSAVRVGQWKLHEYFEDGSLELYDLSLDRGERHNLAQALPEKTAKLKRLLDDWRERVGAPIPTEPNPNYDQMLEAQALVKFE